MTRPATGRAAHGGVGPVGWRLILGSGGGLVPADGPSNMGIDMGLF
jgi:hypothetical protein